MVPVSDNNMSSPCQQDGPAWQRQKSLHITSTGQAEVYSPTASWPPSPVPPPSPEKSLADMVPSDWSRPIPLHRPAPPLPVAAQAAAPHHQTAVWQIPGDPTECPASEVLDQHLWLLNSPQGKGEGLASITMKTALQQLAAGAGPGVSHLRPQSRGGGSTLGTVQGFETPSLVTHPLRQGHTSPPSPNSQQLETTFKDVSLVGWGIPV